MDPLHLGRIAGAPGGLHHCSARELRNSAFAGPRSRLPVLLHVQDQFCLDIHHFSENRGGRGHGKKPESWQN